MKFIPDDEEGSKDRVWGGTNPPVKEGVAKQVEDDERVGFIAVI